MADSDKLEAMAEAILNEFRTIRNLLIEQTQRLEQRLDLLEQQVRQKKNDHTPRDDR